MSSLKPRAVKYDGPWPEIAGLPKPRPRFHNTKVGQLYYLICGVIVALLFGLILNGWIHGDVKWRNFNTVITWLVFGVLYLGALDLFGFILTAVLGQIGRNKYPRLREARVISRVEVTMPLDEIRTRILAALTVFKKTKRHENTDDHAWGLFLKHNPWWKNIYQSDRVIIVAKKKDALSCEIFIALENWLPMWTGMDGTLTHHKTLLLILQALDAEDGRYDIPK